MKETVKFVHRDIYVNKLFMKESKLQKKAKFNDQEEFGLIREAFKSDQGMKQFLFLRKADIYEKIRKLVSSVPITR